MRFDMEAAMRDYVARRDITDAVHRYMRGLDRLDAAMLRSAFHDDAYVETRVMQGSADAFTAFAQGHLAAMIASHHFLGQVRIDMHDGEHASGECYFQAWHAIRDAQGEPRDLFIAGRYIDEYSCKNGAWRISRRKLVTDWIKNDRADHGYLENEKDSHIGRRRGTDFSDLRNWPL